MARRATILNSSSMNKAEQIANEESSPDYVTHTTLYTGLPSYSPVTPHN
jgi:hypothetical protein